ncbi:hypothetical protein S1OALGB6SA_497 [Olavius algarvensis spirochete endosymbiont]|nr:hypothetical protein S1OALGB6SA_497 [Olavius algarvensis spirochete endosymbiont]
MTEISTTLHSLLALRVIWNFKVSDLLDRFFGHAIMTFTF